MKVHLLTEAGTTVPDDFPQADKGAEEISNDPTFPLAFEVTPNKWSAKATTLYLSWLVFRGNKKKGTAEGVRAAWKQVTGTRTVAHGTTVRCGTAGKATPFALVEIHLRP